MNSPIDWDTYFMSVAILTSKRSKDNNTQVGAVIVDKYRRIIGCGYNGFISGLDESLFPTSRDIDLPYNLTKYPYTIHAEQNAILNTVVFDVSGSTMYCTLFPCDNCAKIIAQKRIAEIVYLSDKYHDEPSYIASRLLFDAASIKYRQYTGNTLL